MKVNKDKLFKIFHFILNITWGLPLTLIGAIVALVLICTKHKPKRFGGCIYFNVGRSWGGLELGLFFILDRHNVVHTRRHEFGHSVQNMIFGPLMIPIVCIPSAIRYWYRELKYHRKGVVPPTAYGDIWFEHQADVYGAKYYMLWENNI